MTKTPVLESLTTSRYEYLFIILFQLWIEDVFLLSLQVAKIWPSVAPVELPSDNKKPAAVPSSSQVWMHVDGCKQRALVKGKSLCVLLT